MKRCVNTEFTKILNLDNVFWLLNAYPHLQSHLDLLFKNCQKNQLGFCSLDCLNYIGKLDSHTLNSVTLERITIDMYAFSATLKNVKKMELLNVTFIPDIECTRENKYEKLKMPCEFMCEDLYVENNDKPHCLRVEDDIKKEETLIAFVFTNFTKLKKFALDSASPSYEKRVLKTIIDNSWFPNLGTIYLKTFSITQQATFENSRNIKCNFFRGYNQETDNKPRSGFNQHSLNTLQKTFPLTIPKFKYFDLIIRTQQDLLDILEIETHVPLECDIFRVESWSEKFIVDNIVAILNKFLNYSKETLESIRIVIKYEKKEKKYCGENYKKILSIIDSQLEKFSKCKHVDVNYYKIYEWD